MPDREKVLKGLDCEEYNRCPECPYVKFGKCKTLLVRDVKELLKEQEEQKRRWLQAIADTQLAVSPTGYESEEGMAKRLGEWNGLQMAWDIITGEQKKGR